MPPSSRLIHVWGAALLLAATAGCTKKSLQPDGGGGGILPLPDAGRDALATGDGGISGGGGSGGTSGGGAADAAWDVTFAGRESFVVTSQVTTDGGDTVSHTFTMTVDSQQQIAIIGTPGSGTIVPVEQVADGLRVRFDYTSFAFGVPAVAVCGATVSYSDAVIVIDPGLHLSGTGRGERTTYDPSGNKRVPATAVLTGILDTEGPTLSLAAGGDLGDPWTPLWVIGSEPLPTTQRAPVLRSAGGDVMAFDPQPRADFLDVFARPTRMLRFNDQYYVTFDGITDLMGNAPTSSTSQAFTTRTLPPLVAADGFESVTGATLDGARILSGTGAPTITGARSLYLPPAESLGTSSTVTQFALRVPIAVGNTVLRFSYRIVNPGDGSNVSYVIGSVGGPIGTATLPADVTSPMTPATIDQTPVTLGPIQTTAIGLPGSAYMEVVFARLASQPTSCGGPAPRPVPGVIIDDLHAE